MLQRNFISLRSYEIYQHKNLMACLSIKNSIFHSLFHFSFSCTKKPSKQLHNQLLQYVSSLFSQFTQRLLQSFPGLSETFQKPLVEEKKQKAFTLAGKSAFDTFLFSRFTRNKVAGLSRPCRGVVFQAPRHQSGT